MFCCTLLYVHSSIAIILMGKRELVALLNLSFWCLVMVERLFFSVPRGCGSFMFLFCLVFAMSLCASVYMCFVVTCWERADVLALVCGV